MPTPASQIHAKISGPIVMIGFGSIGRGVLPLLDTVVVSEALGLRKPHPALVRTGLRGLGLPPHEALFVGDTFADDVGAATAAGMDAAWIDARGAGVPDGTPAPRYVLRAFADLRGILECG